MPTDHSKPQSTRRSPRREHEKTDASAGWVFGVVTLLAFIGLLIHIILGGMLTSLKRGQAPTDQWKPVQPAARTAAQLASYPRLQVSPPADLQAFRAREEGELNSYGWVDKSAGIVHIPIEWAIELIVENGLPVRTGTNENQVGPSSYELLQRRSLQKGTPGQTPKR
jgi:hypothetical protein